MKKIIALIMAATVIFSSGLFATAASGVKGDVNGDGIANSADALKVLMFCVGSSGIDETAADVNGDGKINSADALEILKIVVGLSDPVPSDIAEAVNSYNKALKDSYAKKVKVKKTETINIKVEEASGGDVVKNFVNNTILPKYAGTETYEKTFVNGRNGFESIEDFASPTHLDAHDAASAKITKSGSNSVVTIVTKRETSTLEYAPRINRSCAHPLDLASVDIAPAKVTKADFTYPGTTLTATVDSTGKVLKTTINMPVSGTGEGSLGITLHATISGSLIQSCTYTY